MIVTGNSTTTTHTNYNIANLIRVPMGKYCDCCNTTLRSYIHYYEWLQTWIFYKKDQSTSLCCESIEEIKARYAFVDNHIDNVNFHPFATLEQAEEMLANHKFVIRMSSREPGCITITYKHDTLITNYRIIIEKDLSMIVNDIKCKNFNELLDLLNDLL